MRYLRNSDYKYKITEFDLQTLLLDEANSELLILDAEIKSQEQISMFLRKRYDLGILFMIYPEFKNGNSYTTGQTVWYTTGSTYHSQLYAPTGETSTVPTTIDWIANDPRYATILDWMITISLYRLHERIAPSNIPKHRKDSYDETLKVLKMVQEGKVSPDFPEVENRIQNIYIGGVESSGQGFHY